MEGVHDALLSKTGKPFFKSKKFWVTIGTGAGIAGAVLSGLGGPAAIVGIALTGVSYIIAQGHVDAKSIEALATVAASSVKK